MLAVSNTPGKVFAAGELVDNDKLNLLGSPVLTVGGGLEWTQMKVDDVWYGTNAGLVNAYILTLPNANNDRASLVDGVAVCFKPSLTNTLAAATLTLKMSTGTTIISKLIKKRNNQALSVGDLQAGVFYHVRYDSVNDCWQLLSPWASLGQASDATPGQYFYATCTGTATAYVATATPAPTALAAGMHIFLNPPADNTNATLTINLNSLGALGVKKGNAGVLEPGDLVAGQVYLLVLAPTLAYWQVVNPTRGTKPTVVGTCSNAQNLSVFRTSVTDVRVTADQIAVQNPTNNQTHLLTGVSSLASITTSGASGLDSGTEAADLALTPTGVWYYVWLIWNSTSNTTATLFSKSSTAPALPSGYDFQALVGVVRNNAASDFVDFWQTGRSVFIAPQTIFTAKSSAVANTYEAIAGADLTAFQSAVPPNAKVVTGVAGGQESTGVTYIGLAGDATGVGGQEVIGTFGAAMDTFYCAAPVRVPLRTSQLIYFKTGNTTNDHRFDVTGFEI